MKILLSGATGFLGSHLLKGFVAAGNDVVALKRSTSDTALVAAWQDKVVFCDVDIVPLEEIFQDQNIDVVVHTVTDYGRDAKSVGRLLETNLMFSVRLLEAAVHAGVQAFMNTDTLLPEDINAYALSKAQLVQWMRFFSDRLKMVNIKIEHIYGPHDSETKFVSWFCNQLAKGVEKIDLTSGVQKRDFVYIDDVVCAYLAILENIADFHSFETFELGTGTSIKVREFLEMIHGEMAKVRHVDTILNFGAIPYRQKESMEMQADISKLESLGWKPSVTPKEGIKKIIHEEFRSR